MVDGGSWFELMFEVTVVAVCVVPVSWVSQGGLEHTLCPGEGAVGAGLAVAGAAAESKAASRVFREGLGPGGGTPKLTVMVVPVEVVW